MKTIILTAAVTLGMTVAAYSQPPAAGGPPNAQMEGRGAPPEGRGGMPPMGAEGRGRGPGAGFMGRPTAELIFEEGWGDFPMAEPITHDNLSNQDLELHIYGDSDHIRASNHNPDFYTYTGETITNWALTLRDPENSYDLSNGKMMLRTRNTGFRKTHIVIKTLDGQWFASEEGNPESSVWIAREYGLADMHWRVLLMTDTPTNASNQREPIADHVPVVPLGPGEPDLTQVDEIGYSDLIPGGWIPGTSRVKTFAVYGTKVER